MGEFKHIFIIEASNYNIKNAEELVSKIAELESFEREYLYKQGYKDCFRLLKLLDT